MSFDTSDSVYQDLLERVLQSGARVAPFVGAGLSVYGDRTSRLPLWRELLERLTAEGQQLGLITHAQAAAIDTTCRSGEYPDATERILDALGQPTFKRIVERELDDAGKPTPPSIAALVAVDWPVIVTTNLDRLIPRAYFEKHGRPMHPITSLDARELAAAFAGTHASSQTLLAQIHGDVRYYRSWRLTRTQYDELLKDTGYVEALKHLFFTHVFFVGFGLQDDDFDLLLDTVARIYPEGVGVFYALLPRSRARDPPILSLIKRNGLRPIFYEVDDAPGASDPFCGHGQAYECLNHLAVTWARTKTCLDIKLAYFPELDPTIVGRDREIRRLTRLVDAPQGSVVQVVGLGGSGKTSLIQQFLEDRRAEIASAGFRYVFGCSFYRADIGDFVQAMTLAMIGQTPRPGTLTLPEQVNRLCDRVRAERTLLILDGFEALLDPEQRLRNPYVTQIMESVDQGGGTCVVTSRVPVRGGAFDRAPTIGVASLSSEEILEVLERLGLAHLGDAANRRLVEVTAGHPLALRILAGLLRDVPVEDANRTIEQSAVIDISDEIDPLRENRLARVLGSYLEHLAKDEIAFLTCLTAFAEPAPYPLVSAALTRHYPDTSVNTHLLGQDLRRVVGRLLDRGLLTASTGGELSRHPTVQEYFVRYARESGGSLTPIHRYLVTEYLQDAPELPDTFPDAIPLLTACRHAASCGDWSLFDDIFRRRLMRGSSLYLCWNLGAWQEALDLARLGDNPELPTSSLSEPVFYPITVARCLKHLGRSAESRGKYAATLRAAAVTRDPGTAMYVNNFMTLLLWRGELAAADSLLELNIRALSWIGESWKHHWQVEHGFSSFAYLRMFQGNLNSATLLYDYAAHAWDDYADERLWMYDYYPYYRSELILRTSPAAHDEALVAIDSLLQIAHRHGWPESICRGHIQAAVVLLDRASSAGDAVGLMRATRRLDRAREEAAGMNVQDVAIAYCLTRLKAELVSYELFAGAGRDTSRLERLLERASALVETSGLRLASPEVMAARGSVAMLQGSRAAARVLYAEGLKECHRQGNELTPTSPRSLLNWLGRRLGETAAFRSPTSTDDLVSLVGSSLTTEWMLQRLDHLPAPL
jgi:GTPase SAR1 family protein